MRNFADKGAAALYSTSLRLSLLSEAFGAGVAFPASVRHVCKSVKSSSERGETGGRRSTGSSQLCSQQHNVPGLICM